MFKPAGPDALRRARELRDGATEHERRLWSRLRRLNRRGFHFRRQAPFDRYVLDFVDHSAKLVIELDGGQHGTEAHQSHDAARDAFLEGQGYRTLRFWNTELRGNIDAIVDAIARQAEERRRANRE